MKSILDVDTGEVKTGLKDTVLKSNAIGSCVVIVAYDATKQAGALAHVMVPGAAPERLKSHHTRFAKDAIEEIINRMTQLGAKKERMKISLIGGANVLKRENDTIGLENLSYIEKLLTENGLEISGKAVGGTLRRTVKFDIEKGVVYYTEGDSHEMLLWEKTAEKSRKNESL